MASDFRDPSDSSSRDAMPPEPESADYFAVGADDLVPGIQAEAGRAIVCARCLVSHPLSATANLLFYRCGVGSFLAGVDGRLLPHLILAPRDLVD